MHILCTICSDLVNTADNIYGTKCGHIFHFVCLSQWIERSATCPQCRAKLPERAMFRMFPTAAEARDEDAVSLRSKLDDAALQLRELSSAKEQTTEKLTQANAQIENLQDQLKGKDRKLASRDTAIAALKEQMEYLRHRDQDTDKLRKDNQRMQATLATMDSLQRVLNATAQDVERMLESYSDVRTVATFAAALKRALCDSEGKRSESRSRLQRLQNDLNAETKRRANADQHNAMLEQRLRTLEAKVQERSSKRKADADEQESNSERKLSRGEASLPDSPNGLLTPKESGTPSPYLMLRQGCPALLMHTIKPTELAKLNAAKENPLGLSNTLLTPQEQGTIDQQNTPCSSKQTHSDQPKEKVDLTQTKSGLKPGLSLGQASRPGRVKPATGLSIFSRAQSGARDFFSEPTPALDVSYDGLGGHSKPDEFPRPLTRPSPRPLPRLAPKPSAKHRLKRPPALRTLDNFLGLDAD